MFEPKEKNKLKAIPRDKAVEELEKWFEAKKISGNKRKTNEDIEEELVDAIEDGYLVLNDDHTWTQKLKFPIDNANVSELRHAFRINIGVLNAKLRGVKIDDIAKRVQSYVCVLTDQPNAVVGSLDTVDYSIASSIATYFF